MTFLESLAIYTTSQKTVAMGFIACGLLLGLGALLVQFSSSLHSPLWQGVKTGSIVLAVLIGVGGIGYWKFSDSTQHRVAAQYEQNSLATLAKEEARMEKVVSDYQRYQLAFAAMVLIALVVIIWGSAFWAGVSFAVAFLFVAVLLIEAQSKYSIDAHYHHVSDHK